MISVKGEKFLNITWIQVELFTETPTKIFKLWHVTPYNLLESNDGASIIRINDSGTIVCPVWKWPDSLKSQ
jgi:hypothetical protein